MSQENVEAFKRIVEAGMRFDADGLIAEMDPDVEWHTALLASLTGNESAVVRGHGGMQYLVPDLEDVFGELEHAEALATVGLAAYLPRRQDASTVG